MTIEFSTYYTLILAVIVLLIGKLMVRRIRFLREFNIPEPVAGGLVAALVAYGINLATGYRPAFDSSLQTAFMLCFFSSIGLSANFAKLRAGGSALVVFLLVIVVFVFVQNGVGVALASLLGLDPLIGLIAGSITLLGGHGTAGAWGGRAGRTARHRRRHDHWHGMRNVRPDHRWAGRRSHGEMVDPASSDRGRYGP